MDSTDQAIIPGPARSCPHRGLIARSLALSELAMGGATAQKRIQTIELLLNINGDRENQFTPIMDLK
jgi:hypothetical protein